MPVPVITDRTRSREHQMPKTKAPRRAKGWELRNPIIDKLKQNEQSNYWLAHKVAEANDITPDAIYRYLRAETDASGHTIAACYRILKIKVA